MQTFTFDFTEWLNIAARWIHVFAGIMWVGQTYFFTWLDGRFTELEHVLEKKSDENIWMVHSGGFYLVSKQKIPKLMPSKLYWFKWEAAITWMSGITLLILVYYLGGLMVSENVSESTAMWIGIGVLVMTWPVYDFLWNSIKNETLGLIISYILIVTIAYTLTHIMDGRAAYIHIGAMFGTIMTANVWQRILPAQRKMVVALNEGKTPNEQLAHRAKTRSKHNTFMAVPVVFIMISNHYPVTSYGDSYNWVILSLLILIGFGAAKIIRKA